jgi:hypothetical protein
MKLRHCLTCNTTTEHQHLHDCAHGIFETHMSGSERFVCTVCHRSTFAYSPGADTFRFVLDGIERQAVLSHAMARR